MFNDSAHSKRNHKRNFPSFSFQISKYNFACDFFDLLFVFVPREGERMASASKLRKKNLYFFLQFCWLSNNHQVYIRNTDILCVWKSYIIIFFPLKFFRFIIFQQFFCTLYAVVCLLLVAQQFLVERFCCVFFLSSLFAMELVCALTWWVFGFQDSTFF